MESRNIVIGILVVALIAVGIGWFLSSNTQTEQSGEKDNQIASLNQQLQEQQATLDERNASLTQTSQQLQDLRGEADNKDQQLADLNRQLTESQQLVAAQQEKMNQLKVASPAGNTSDTPSEVPVAANTTESTAPSEIEIQLRAQIDSLQQEIERLRSQQTPSEATLGQEPVSTEKVQQALVKSLEKEIENNAIQITAKDQRVAIHFGQKVYFASGKATINSEFADILDKIGKVLEQFDNQHIQVEGHTDSRRIGQQLKRKFETNWELSVARSARVVRYLIDNAGMDPTRISATGYGRFRPVAGNDTPEDRQMNRRVEFVLLPADF